MSAPNPVPQLTVEQAVILTGATGILCCDLIHLQAGIERRTGRTVEHGCLRSDWLTVRRRFRDELLAILPHPAPTEQDGTL